MNTPFFGDGNESLLSKIEQEKNLSKQRRQRQANQALPPAEVQTNADAALLAVKNLTDQNLVKNSKREQESQEALQSVDEADRFEQNAQIAKQAADESSQLAQSQRQEADQLTQLHQQEEAQDAQDLDQATTTAQVADLARIGQDPEVLKQILPDVAKTLGVNVKAINADVERDFKDVQDIFAGQIDRNNARQLKLQEKIVAGKGFSKGEKIALGMAAILPIIIGAARGDLGRGLAAAGKAVETISNQQLSRQSENKAELENLEARGIDLAKDKLAIRTQFLNQKGKVSSIELAQEAARESSLQNELRNKGLKLSNVSAIEKAKQQKIITKDAILKFDEKVRAIAEGKSPEAKNLKISGDQRKAATFSVRMAGSEDIFGVLEKEGFSPIEGEGFLINRLKTEQRQSYEQAQRNFINALLRRESGAAISDTEFESGGQQYFPQPGDTPLVVAQKKANRAVAIAGLQAEAGKQAIQDIHDLLGEQAPVTRVEQEETTTAPTVDFSEMSDEELKRIVEGE